MRAPPSAGDARRIAIAAALLAGAVACGPRAAATPAATPAAHDAGYQAVLERTDIRGNPLVAGGEYRATVVVVFASWCRPCRDELALLREMSRERPAMRVIGVNAYEDFDDLSDERKLVAFLIETHPWLTVVRGDSELLRQLGGVSKIPTVFVYDRRGTKIKAYRRSQRTPPTRAELAQLIDPLLG